jgi:hypothetical protein
MRAARFLTLITIVSAAAMVSLSGAQRTTPARVESCGPDDVVPGGLAPLPM